MKIKELCEEERPREKMLSRGANNLSNGELLAILLRSGTKNLNVLELAQVVLSKCNGSLGMLSNLNYKELSKIPGIGSCKAIELMTVFELGRRFVSEQKSGASSKIASPKIVFDIMRPLLKGLDHEETWILLLSPSMRLLEKRRISIGSASAATINITEILRQILDRKAAMLILVHNHPSENPNPSMADIKFTSELREAACTFGVSLSDHVIISDTSYYSFADEKIYYLNSPI